MLWRGWKRTSLTVQSPSLGQEPPSLWATCRHCSVLSTDLIVSPYGQSNLAFSLISLTERDTGQPIHLWWFAAWPRCWNGACFSPTSWLESIRKHVSNRKKYRTSKSSQGGATLMVRPVWKTGKALQSHNPIPWLISVTELPLRFKMSTADDYDKMTPAEREVSLCFIIILVIYKSTL